MAADPIVVMIEEELARLHHVRSILASLLDFAGPEKVRQAPAPIKEPTSDSALAIAPPITRFSARERRRNSPRKSKPIEQAAALKGAIPSWPVVIRPSVPKPVEQASESPVLTTPGSFAAMVRAAERDVQAES